MHKRKFHRLLLVTEIEHNPLNSKESAKATTKNISLGGICITTVNEPLKNGGIYELSFKIPGENQSIMAEGRVVWNRLCGNDSARMYDNGIEFTKIKGEYLEIIESYSIGSIEKD
jgi:c-di-GMP-binding flagellar brake protein YcgR